MSKRILITGATGFIGRPLSFELVKNGYEAVVLSRRPAIPRLIPPFRFFLGGHPGSGRQWLAWIHIEDVIGVIRLLVENPNCEGPFNVTAPKPILSKNFYNLLGKTMHRPAVFPMPAFALKLMLGEMATELLLPSQKVIPQKLIDTGYKYKFPDLSTAFRNILKETR